MISAGMAEVLRSLPPVTDGTELAAACAGALRVDGVSVALLRDGSVNEPLWHHPHAAGLFEELQLTLGEGPGRESLRSGLSVTEPDLAAVRADRWPALLPAAQALGVHGVCCFPLGMGGARIGVLTVLTAADRRLSHQQYADALALASVLTGVFLGAPARPPHPAADGGPAEPGTLPGGPNHLHLAVVHQASGMVSVQLGVPIAEALVRLRAHAFSTDRPLGEVAGDVVARRLRFSDDDGPSSPDRRKG